MFLLRSGRVFNFWRSGLSSLRKEITIVIILKLFVLALIWYFCFSDPLSKHLTSRLMQQHILNYPNNKESS
ncbi:hypothetical protein CBUD_1083 [Coxiella burnetii Dugway 5J108-111]|uniref:Uncharacterized protein n=1 Tax=Coxiella burnetii (strain Dugway 5J108-111) TaxID=434922 RepID=A9KCF9_COXBN|nr:hypothetical protein CBUD_1083 [Coxiella burnetii Dugway 5J108-111]